MKIDYNWSVAKEGYLPILTSFFICWLGTAFFGLSIISLILFCLFLVVLYFFRDPERILPNTDGIISPAGGKIVLADTSIESNFTNEEMNRICIFLSIVDCHINRAPVNCAVNKTIYNEGKFHLGNSVKAIENERLSWRINYRRENTQLEFSINSIVASIDFPQFLINISLPMKRPLNRGQKSLIW